MISVDEKMLESAFNIKIDQKQMEQTTTNYMNDISEAITTDITPAANDFDMTLVTFATDIFKDYMENPLKTMALNPMDPEMKIPVLYATDVKDIVNTFMLKESSKKFINELEKNYVIPASIYTQTFTQVLESYLGGYIQTASEMMGGLKDEDGWLIAPAPMDEATINQTVQGLMSQAMIQGLKQTMATQMTEAVMKKDILTNVGNLTQTLMGSVANAFDVNPDKIAAAFKFDLSEEELQRIMSTMMSSNEKKSAASNLSQLGYQDLEEPTNMSFYFNSFDAKERFLEFIDKYNDKQESNKDDDKIIRYTDLTGILMSSVKTIVNSVSYVLIAFVSISLVVSCVMTGIITYNSVLERIKEIGVLRAVGARKKDVGRLFKSESTIIGVFSGLLGVIATYLMSIPINLILNSVFPDYNIGSIANLDILAAIILVIISGALAFISGIIPARNAARKDPVIALRSE
jgi:ABC-type antimicrobial peptide transport system permease subunit